MITITSRKKNERTKFNDSIKQTEMLIENMWFKSSQKSWNGQKSGQPHQPYGND